MKISEKFNLTRSVANWIVSLSESKESKEISLHED